MCHHKDRFSTYDSIDSVVVHMGNDVQCNVIGIGTIKIKTHDDAVRTLSNVHHVPDLKCNLISLGIIESKGFKYSSEGRILKVSKGTQILLKRGLRQGSLYVLQESATTDCMRKCPHKSLSSTKFTYHLKSFSSLNTFQGQPCGALPF